MQLEKIKPEKYTMPESEQVIVKKSDIIGKIIVCPFCGYCGDGPAIVDKYMPPKPGDKYAETRCPGCDKHWGVDLTSKTT